VCNPKNGNVFDGPEQQRVEIDAERNYVYTSGKAVALVGVNDLVVVETEDALLITTHSRSQDVGRIVADLKGRGHEDLI
jgi:mannose-1-phosphate guanylyltransferase